MDRTYLEKPDDTLVALTLAGDQDAYEALVRRYEKTVLAVAQSVTGNRYLAEDAAQDAFVSAWLKLDTLREHSSYAAWVRRIAVNSARGLVMRYRDWLSIDEPETAALVAEMPAPEADYTALHDSIGRLTEKVRTVIHLHYFEGLSIEDIADRLRLPVGTVKWRLHEGREKLRKDLMSPNEKETDTLVERVMKRVADFKLTWNLRNSKEGFTEAYNNLLAEIEKLPESREKYNAMADVLQYGWWFLPGEKNEEMLERLREAAEKGNNREVLAFLITRESNKYSGQERINIIRDKQIPRLVEMGLTEALAHEWFWLGIAHRCEGQMEEARAAYEKAVAVSEPWQMYHANALSALAVEAELAAANYPDASCGTTYAETYRQIGGRLYRLSQPGYWTPSKIKWIGAHGRINFISAVGETDSILFDDDLRVGESLTGSDGSTLTLEDDAAETDTPAGTFRHCKLFVCRTTSNNYRDPMCVRAWYKRGIGLVRLEQTLLGRISRRVLTSYHIEGGTGLYPLAPGNRWSYAAEEFSPEILSVRMEVFVTAGAAPNGESDATVGGWWTVCRNSYDRDSFEDMLDAVDERAFYKDGNEVRRPALPEVTAPYLTRAEELAQTPLERATLHAYRETLERIQDGDSECCPSGTWYAQTNRCEIYPLFLSDGDIALSRHTHRACVHYWRDEHGCPYDLLHQSIFCHLNLSLQALWSDSWVIGESFTRQPLFGNPDARVTATLYTCRDYMGCDLTTRIGHFSDCLVLETKTENYGSFLNGTARYWFVRGIGLVRVERDYSLGKVPRYIAYELVSYEGTGEGYFPIAAGMRRRFGAGGLPDHFDAWSEYAIEANRQGELFLITNEAGMRKRDAEL